MSVWNFITYNIEAVKISSTSLWRHWILDNPHREKQPFSHVTLLARVASGSPQKGQVLVGSWFFLIFFLRIYFSVHCKRRGLSLCICDALDFMKWKARGKLPRDKGKVCSVGSQPSKHKCSCRVQYTSCFNKELHNSSIPFKLFNFRIKLMHIA